MNRYVELGANKTGITSSPELADQMVQGTEEFVPSSAGDAQEIARVRADYTEAAPPLGSVPPPAMLDEEIIPEQSPAETVFMTQLIDKLGARLAFERAGVRLYTALINKYDVLGSFTGGPQREDLERIRAEELEHFHLLMDAIEELGGDSTAITPAADVQATLSKGIWEVLVDPRTTFAQGLEAILMAELADNDAWSTLTVLAEQAGEDELVAQFEQAEEHEREHLDLVRNWLSVSLGQLES